jgi:hypothetical protein
MPSSQFPNLQNDQRTQHLSQLHHLQAQTRAPYADPISPTPSSLDYMHLNSQLDRVPPPQSDGDMTIQSPSFMQDQGIFSEAGADQRVFAEDTMQGLPFGMYGNGWNTELPSYIHELLSGAPKY